MDKELCFWIEGQPPRKSNSRQIVTNRRTGKPMIMKSPAAQAWVKDAFRQISGKHKLKLGSRERPVSVTCFVLYRDRRPDLSVELILDVLEEAEVLSNDRHVYVSVGYKLFSKKRQGVLILVTEVEKDFVLRLAHVLFPQAHLDKLLGVK